MAMSMECNCLWVLDPLELVVRHPVWVLGTELNSGPLAEQSTAEPLLKTPQKLIFAK